nr:hypothetical protein [Saprospiraceae bacterium]
MKLRIKGNSVRLRLTQSEVDQFNQKGFFEQRCIFGPAENQQLTYRIEKKDGILDLAADFNLGTVVVFIPTEMGENWAATEEVGMENQQPLSGEDSMRMLIEKDFQCLKPRPEEDESDNYPNPEALHL